MTRGQRAKLWFRRRPKAVPLPPPGPSPADRYFIPPPAVEALPSYSSAVDDVATSSPPQITALPLEPPPDYQISSAVSQPPLQPASPTQPHRVQFTPSQQRRHLEDIFSRQPWRRLWGPQPTCFTDALNKGALLGNQQLLTALFDLGVEVRGNLNQATHTTTPVHEALRGPKPWFALAFIGRLQDAGGEARELLESKNAAGCTPLHVAAEAGETAIARTFILFHGAEVDAVDNYGRTPLHMAARYGRTETVGMLLDCGADPGRINEELWLQAEKEERRQELFGSYTLIWNLLGSILDSRGAVVKHEDVRDDRFENEGGNVEEIENEGQRGESEGDEDPGAENDEAYTSSRPPLMSSGELSADPAPRRYSSSNPTSPPRRHPGSLRGNPFTEEMASRFITAYGNREVETALRVMRHHAESSTSRRPVQTMRFTPEYTRWRNGCEILQDESRTQREKNKREGGNEFDFY